MKDKTKLTVLIIEDNISDSLLIMQFLTKKDPAVRFVILSDGPSAINFLKRLNDMGADPYPDLIILNNALSGGMDGRDVLKFIKQDTYLKLSPVVIFTSVEDSHEINGAYADSANCYMIKPVELEVFEECMNTLYSHWLEYASRPDINDLPINN